MAPYAKVLSFLFLLSLLFTHQAQARDSQFFSKVTTTNTNTNNDNVKETELPKKDNTLNNQEQEQEQEQPSFIPETQSGYGLYGHESGQFPPSTTTTTTTTHNNNNNNNVPYTAELEKEQQHTDNYPNRYQTQYNPNKNVYYNGNNYPSNPSDTRLAQSSYTAAKTATPIKYNQNSNYYNVERQGMSDTRFLENGKYYHDPSSENNQNFNQQYNQQYNQNQYENSRVVDSRNWYNNRGNYGNNYNNNNVHQNSYQNQEEFQENEDEFNP